MHFYKRQNWGNYQTWFPKNIVYPTSLKELRQIVSDAKTSNAKIRLAGSLHSMNSLCVTDETQIETGKLCRVLSIDRTKLTVKVEGGIIIKKLLKILAKNGLTLANQGYIVDQSIAGAIATATHGSGKTGTLSSFIEEIELLDAEGNLRVLTKETTLHLFSAAIVNLGCLGIVYSLTLRCIPLEKVVLSKIKSDVSTTFRELPSLLKENDYFQFAIDPYSDTLIRWEYKITQEDLKNRGKYYLKWLLVKTLAVLSFDLFTPPYWLVPSSIKLYMAASQLKSCIDYSYKLLSPADEGHYIEEEIAVPFDDLKEALHLTRQIVDHYRTKKVCLVAVILIRFCEADPLGYLSPANNRQTAYISLISIAKEGYKQLFNDVETALSRYKGRPHWGKYHTLTRERVIDLYGNDYQSFMSARHELDPKGLFLNEYLQHFFF